MLSCTTSSASCSFPVIRKAKRKTERLWRSTSMRKASESPERALVTYVPSLRSIGCSLDCRVWNWLARTSLKWVIEMLLGLPGDPRPHDLLRNSRITRRECVTVLGAAAGSIALPAGAADTPPDTAPQTNTVPIALQVNRQQHSLQLDPRVTLLDLLREHLALTGTKKGCDHGQCGACTVLVNGRRINSCLSLAVSHDGDEITTVEGVARGDQLHPVQAAFIAHDGFQCGFCTPGQIMSAIGLIEEGQAGDDPERVREGMSGNLCRCGAYSGITDAVLEVQKSLNEANQR